MGAHDTQRAGIAAADVEVHDDRPAPGRVGGELAQIDGVRARHRESRQHGDRPRAPDRSVAGAGAPSRRFGRSRRGRSRRRPWTLRGPQARAPARRRGRRERPGSGPGRRSARLSVVSQLARPRARPWARRRRGTQHSWSMSTSASMRRQASTTSKGRPHPSTPPCTLKLATTTRRHSPAGYRAGLRRPARLGDPGPDRPGIGRTGRRSSRSVQPGGSPATVPATLHQARCVSLAQPRRPGADINWDDVVPERSPQRPPHGDGPPSAPSTGCGTSSSG